MLKNSEKNGMEEIGIVRLVTPPYVLTPYGISAYESAGTDRHNFEIALVGTASSDNSMDPNYHDDVIKWKHFPRYWPFVRGTHRSLLNSPHKGQWHSALVFLFWSAPHG